MKKLVFFLVCAFITQMFCENAFGQDWTQNYNNYIFKINSEEYMRISRGVSYDLQMYFPHTVSGGGPRWNRIIAQGQLAFSTNNRGLSDNSVDMLINASGNVGIGGLGSDATTEKLTVNGNILASEYKITNGGGMYAGRYGVGLYVNNANQVIDFNINKNATPDFTMLYPTSGAQYPIFAIHPKGRLVASESYGDIEFAGGKRGILNGDIPPDMIIKANGNIGIGTTSPSEKLTVYGGNIKIENSGKFMLQNTSRSMNFEINPAWTGGGQNYLGIVTTTNHGLLLGANNNAIMNVMPNNGKGYVIFYKDGTGSSPDEISAVNKNKYAVFVEGGILSEDFAIGPKNTWSDFVFDSNYELKSLNEVESYIEKNKHLPDMPSATEVENNGYNLHDMNAKLLQKVEELTLYSIEQDKTIKMLLKKMEQLESKINK